MGTQSEFEAKFLHYAAAGHLAGVKQMINVGASIEAVDYNGRTALHLAAERGHLALVEHLLAVGADVNRSDREGETPFTLAMKNHQAVHTALCRNGCSTRPPLSTRGAHANLAAMKAFPKTIVLALFHDRKMGPISRQDTCLFFSDIVGYTQLCASMQPCKVADMLVRLYQKLDKLAAVHGVQKVDIVGDAYIAATNFTEDQPQDHASRLARFAMNALKVAQSTVIDEDAEMPEFIQMRVGMHCGPVTGVVVGSSSFKYTLLGEAVSFAARMESTGLANRIQCSRPMAELVAQQAGGVQLVLRRGGGVEVEGTIVETFWLSSARQMSLDGSGSWSSSSSSSFFASAGRLKACRLSSSSLEEAPSCAGALSLLVPVSPSESCQCLPSGPLED